MSARNSKSVDVGKVDRPFTILYTSVRSALVLYYAFLPRSIIEVVAVVRCNLVFVSL